MADYTLYRGDCLIEMDRIADKSVDAVICDPPYQITSCAWDTMIPFEPMWKQIKRVVKDRAAVVLFGSEPFSSLLRVSNLDWYKYDWVWKKTRPMGFLHAKNAPLAIHENISVFSPGSVAHINMNESRMTYSPQMENGEPYKKFNKVESKHKWGGIGRPSNHDYTLINCGTRYPVTVLEFSNHNDNNSHPTQKPQLLLEYLVKTYTNEGDTVLDFTMGSGTTGAACGRLNRNFIGIEIR